MIPGLNDSELERILKASQNNGAICAGYILLRLPHQVKDIFGAWLKEHYPDRAEHVLNLIRETRSGHLYQNQFGTRMSGTGPYAELLKQRFDLTMKQLNLKLGPRQLTTRLFEVPEPIALKSFSRQLPLFAEAHS